MGESQLKLRVSQLWKETFHDSDEYISLVFDNYFDERYCVYEEIWGELAGALIGIPYSFGSNDNKVSALYLCGLATKPKFRSRGIMTRLLAKINSIASEDGFVFTFLIPADAGLRKFYHDREYVNAFYRVIDNYTSSHNFDLEYESFLQQQKNKVIDIRRRYFESLKIEEISREHPVEEKSLSDIIDCIKRLEGEQDGLQILHSNNDIKNIINENCISGGYVFVIRTAQNIVTAVAFCSLSDLDMSVDIHKLFSTDVASKYKVFDAIKRKFPESSMQHYIPSIEMDRKALWFRTYGSFLHEAPQASTISVAERVYSLAAHAKVYGMVRVLNLPEILKFQAKNRRDLKYSILVKGIDESICNKFEVKDGELIMSVLPVESLSPAQRAYIMSKRDVCEIVFRRRDTDNLITEAFGIPSISASISLMLD